MPSVAKKLQIFNPGAKLDPGQVEDLRMPAPMDVVMRGGHPAEWYDSPNAGGISWNPMQWTINPGPMNTGHRTYPEQPLPGDATYDGREGGRKPGTGSPDPEAQSTKPLARKARRTGLKTYKAQVR